MKKFFGAIGRFFKKTYEVVRDSIFFVVAVPYVMDIVGAVAGAFVALSVGTGFWMGLLFVILGSLAGWLVKVLLTLIFVAAGSIRFRQIVEEANA